MKKMFKKIIACISALSMLPMVSAFADTATSVFELDDIIYTPNSWTIQRVETGYTNGSNPNNTLTSMPAYNYAEVAYNQGRTGSALALNWEDAQLNHVSIRVRQNSITLDEGNYNLTFWVKGETVKNLSVGFVGTTGAWYAIPNATIRTSETDGAWVKYSCPIDLTNDDEDTTFKGDFQFILQAVTNVLIDDVVLKKLDANNEVTGNNLLVNGDFEAVSKAERDIKNNGTAPSEWYMTDNNIVDDSVHYIAVDRTVGRTDSTSLYVYGEHKAIVTDSGTTWQYMQVSSPNILLKAGKKYNFSFYTKGNKDMHAGVNGTAVLNSSNYTITTEGDWTKYEKVLTPASDYYGSVKFNIYTKPNFRIDDVTVEEQDNPGVNLVGNASFADYDIIPKTAVGDTTANNWSIGYGIGTDAEKKGKTIFAETSVNEAKTGTRSMLLAMPVAYANNSNIYFSQTIDAPAGEYTLTFWAKGSYFINGMRAILGTKDSNSEYILFNEKTNSTGVAYTDGETDGEWRKYQYTFTADGARTRLAILATQDIDYIYVDDISLVDANGKEYVTNGSFEDVKIINLTEIENLMAYPIGAGEAANISWVNPKNENISLKLYVDGEEYTDFNGADYSESEAYNEFLLEGLSNWKNYKIKLELTIGSTTKAYETSVIPRAGVMKIKGWSVTRNDKPDAEGVKHFANVTVDIDRTVGYNSNTSLLVNSNRDGYQDGCYATIAQTVQCDTTKPYQFKFKAKLNNARSARSLGIIIQNEATKTWIAVKEFNVTGVNVNIKDIGNGWTQYTYTISPLGLGTVPVIYRIATEDWADSINIDDIELYQLDEDEWEPVGNNLISDASFEYDDYIVTEPVIDYYLVDEELGTAAWVTDITETAGEGKYRARVNVQNVFADVTPITVVLAGYKGGKLVDFVPAIGYVSPNQWATYEIKAECEFESGCTIKAMVWQGNDWSMIPEASVNTVKPKAN